MKGIKSILGLAFLLGTSSQVLGQAGNPFLAYPDNAFIKPDADYYTKIDVLANDIYFFDKGIDCTHDELELTILTPATKGRYRISDDNQVEYQPRPGSIGAEELVYQIYCPLRNKTATATIYININDKPNPISDVECYVDPTGIPFNMKEIARYGGAGGYEVLNTSFPLVGDLDGDKEVEIVVFGTYYRGSSPNTGGNYDHIKILTLRGNTIVNKYPDIEFPMLYNRKESSYTPFGNLALVKVNKLPTGEYSKYASIIMATDQGLLLKYDMNSSGTAYELTYNVTFEAVNPQYMCATPVIADFMGTGDVQISVNDKIYDAETLTLLVDAGFVPTTQQLSPDYSFGKGAHLVGTFFPNAAGKLMLIRSHTSSTIAVDIDDDGVMELIGGNCVYDINITNFSGTAGNTFTLRHKLIAPPGRPEIKDGATSIADVNLDGVLDVVVSTAHHMSTGSGDLARGGMYVYNSQTAQLIHNNAIDDIRISWGGTSNSFGPSRPFIGDIDNGTAANPSPHPEIALSAQYELRAYKYNPTTTNIELMWNLKTTDSSASTTLSLFDFDQSKEAKLVYRDETALRIIDKLGTTLATVGGGLAPSGEYLHSATINEFPIVADINDDGHAEIIVTATETIDPTYPKALYWTGKLMIFGADATSDEKLWAPARKVWNQTGYNPLWINDDLTVPTRPISPATAFVAPDGTKNYPFNNFLQQATSLNKEGTMIMLGPDLTFDSRVAKRLTFDDAANTLTVSAGIMNQGDSNFKGDISFQLYAYFKDTDTYEPVGAPYIHPNTSLKNTAPDNVASVSYTIPNKSTALRDGYNNLYITVNLTSVPGDQPVFNGSSECHDGWNNVASGLSVVSGRRIMCEGATEKVTVTPSDTYTIRWYNSATSLTVINTGDEYTMTKNADPVTHLFVEAYSSPSATSPISSIRDTIFVYRTADSLVWTGKGGTLDWHDHLNWANPDPDYPALANIPRGCTNVLIPNAIANYPDLSPSITNYADYKPACNNIHFDFGGEVIRPDALTYSKAFVDVALKSHRWQMFAPPLKDFYTGDIYIKDIIPFNDDVKTYTKYWARRNPMNSYYTAGWTGLFNQPDQSFQAGQALGVWISDKSISGQINPPRDPFDFSFPKYDTTYRIYQEDTNIPEPSLPIFNTPRNKHHKFIFDGTTPGADFDLKIDGEIKTAGQMVLVGNPFMAHLDFDKFYQKNQAFIQNYYCVLDENAILQYYNKDASSTLLKDIAPMQAFLVEIKAPFTNLKANGLMTVSVPGDKLKSAPETPAGNFHLRVSATQEGHTSQAFILFEKDADNAYKAGEDIAGLYPTKVTSDSRSLSLYSLTQDGTKASVNKLNPTNLKDRIIPLGIWIPKDEGLMINVSNINEVPSGYTLFLYDKLTDNSYNLIQNSMKYFENIKADKNLFVDNRFFLKFEYSENGSSINEERSDNLTAWVKSSTLYLQAEDNLKQIEVYNLQGQLLYSSKLNTSSAECKLPHSNIYIVKIKSDTQVSTKKLINQ